MAEKNIYFVLSMLNKNFKNILRRRTKKKPFVKDFNRIIMQMLVNKQKTKCLCI